MTMLDFWGPPLPLGVLALTLGLSQSAFAQSFSCPIGREPACLDYGDRVVDQSAACFESYQCDYEGFTCKSNVTDCTADYDKLRVEYNSLIEEHNALVRDFNNLRDNSQMLDQEVSDMQRCITWAQSVEEAHDCAN